VPLDGAARHRRVTQRIRAIAVSQDQKSELAGRTLALLLMAIYGGRPDELLELELFDSWQSLPDTRGIAVMRIT